MPERAAQIRADLSLAAIDVVLVMGAYLAVLVLRFDAAVPDEWWTAYRRFILVAVFAVLFLGERLTGPNWLGIGLIATGTVLVAYRG